MKLLVCVKHVQLADTAEIFLYQIVGSGLLYSSDYTRGRVYILSLP